MALEKTRRNRPDLLATAKLTRDDHEFLRQLAAAERNRREQTDIED